LVLGVFKNDELVQCSAVFPQRYWHSFLASMVPLDGQDQSTSVGAAEPIATDRPAVTDSSVVVPAGSLQVENGFLETSSQGQSVLDAQTSTRLISMSAAADHFIGMGYSFRFPAIRR
jgi:hypothetical protein